MSFGLTALVDMVVEKCAVEERVPAMGHSIQHFVTCTRATDADENMK